MGALICDNLKEYNDSKFWIKHKDVLKKIDSLPDCLTLKSQENELWLYDEKSFSKFVELLNNAEEELK
jgi:hypothetical protein